MERQFKYLINRRVVWRQEPTTDIPDEETSEYMFFKKGTYQYYNLFRSKAKITTYRSFKWHMLVLWYLNPSWEKKDALDIAMYLSYKPNGFTTFTINKWNVERLVEDVYNMELDEPPRNKLRKIVFKQFTGLDKIDKLRIVGKLIGRLKGVDSTDIYEAMLQTNYKGNKITISGLAKLLNVTPRTIYRRMNKYPALKQEKEILNEET